MKDLLKLLPQILEMMPGIVKYLKYIPILMILAGIGYGVYGFTQSYRDPYKCVNNEVYEQIRVDSGVYVFKGGYCVEDTAKPKEEAKEE
jgi:hypothetical protein